MKKPSIPENEIQRIETLHGLHIFDTPIEESFERITRLAKKYFEVLIVAFRLIDSERQCFKSIQGHTACRKEDVVARWSGEEFVVLFDPKSSTKLAEIAERVRMEISDEQIYYKKYKTNIKAMYIGKNRVKNRTIECEDDDTAHSV